MKVDCTVPVPFQKIKMYQKNWVGTAASSEKSYVPTGTGINMLSKEIQSRSRSTANWYRRTVLWATVPGLCVDGEVCPVHDLSAGDGTEPGHADPCSRI